LGIEFSLDLNRITEINFSKKIKELSAILKSWQHRKLTLMGKITVIKSLALSKLVHLLTALPNLAHELTSLFYNFIWNNKPDRAKRNTSYMPTLPIYAVVYRIFKSSTAYQF
jgi:hypothetical protein